MDLSSAQQLIIRANDKHIVVIAAAGSGKTSVLTERIRRLLNEGNDPKTMVAITFTNNAADQMKERLGAIATGMFIGTVHAYANYLLLSNGIDTHDYLEREDFDHLFKLVNDHPSCLKPVHHLLVDEVQDSTSDQFDFFRIINADNWFFVGDHRQSIFQYAGAVPQLFLDLTRSGDVRTYYLNENYRCGERIIDFAKSISRLNGLDYEDHTIAMRNGGRVVNTDYSPTAIARTIEQMKDYKNWFILCRTNDQVESMCKTLNSYAIPCDTFKKKELTLAELNKRMEADAVKVLTIHASKGLERKNVIVIGARFYNTEEKCISYVAATRARDLLVWARIPTKPKRMRTTQNWEH